MGLPNSTGKATSLFTFKMHAVDQAVNHLKRMQFLIRANDTIQALLQVYYCTSAISKQVYSCCKAHSKVHFPNRPTIILFPMLFSFPHVTCMSEAYSQQRWNTFFFSSYKSQQWTTPFTQSTSSEILTLHDPGMWSYNQNFISSFLDAYM